MAKNQLTPEDRAFISEFDKQYSAVIETLERAKQFKLGDYLVLYLSDANGNMGLKKNSYGAPVKYKVVFVNNYDIPFIKQVNKKGNPVGSISSCAGSRSDEYRHINDRFEFALDPDYADAILLQDEYDPANLHRSKKDIWKAVTDHNKACKIKTQDIKQVVDFFKTVNVGDTLWSSNVTHYLVQDKKILSPADFNKNTKYSMHTRIKGPFVTVLTVRDKNGKVKDISPDFFHWKALYKERPRTYKELNI